MNLRDWVEFAMADEVDDKTAAIMGLTMAVQILCSTVQQESATFEGCLASLDVWAREYGVPTVAKVRRWMNEDSRTLFDVEVPDSAVEMAMSGRDDDDEEGGDAECGGSSESS